MYKVSSFIYITSGKEKAKTNQQNQSQNRKKKKSKPHPIHQPINTPPKKPKPKNETKNSNYETKQKKTPQSKKHPKILTSYVGKKKWYVIDQEINTYEQSSN